MKPRGIVQLVADGETSETLRSALDELAKLKPVTMQRIRECTELREELLQELRTIEAQGSLF